MEERQSIKPFKTISLTDKLKGSIYDKDFKKTVNQQLSKTGASLKELPPTQIKESVLLKSLADSPQANIPLARTQFASNISLADRLEQPNAAKTTHLAQYFLSDVYTGYLSISPFLTAAIGSIQNVTITEEPVSVSQILRTQDPDTQLTARIADNTTLLTQGTFFNNGAFESIVDLEDRVSSDTILIGQGTRFTNNQFISLTEVLPDNVNVNQGSIELPTWNPITNQGLTVEESKPANANSVAILQGMFLENGIIEGSVLNKNVFQTITLENFTVPALDILSYETDRLLAFAAPKIKHGSADLSISQFLENQTEAVNDPTQVHGSVNLSVSQFLESRTQAFNDPIQFHGTAITEQVQFNPNNKLAQTPAVDSTSTAGDKNNDGGSTDRVQDPGAFTYNNNQPGGKDGGGGVLSKIDGGIGESGRIGYGQGSMAAYRGMFYGDLISGLGPNQGPFSSQDPNQEPGAANGTNLIPSIVATDTMQPIGGVDPHAESGGDFKDFVDIKFTHDGKTEKLKAYLTAYSDGFSANWNDVQYVGRQDTLKQFAGVTRAISFAVLLPSFKKGDIDINMKKLNLLAGMTVVGGFNNGAKYITGPLCKLKIGNLIDAYCAFSSLKWDFDPAEATFDIDEGMPHMLKVSLDATVLSDGDDKLLNGKNGNYFGKKY
tara:strand:+ start:3859 stop:5847 length:1989 start_codon:yes stop_codon:yes gene_type:complete